MIIVLNDVVARANVYIFKHRKNKPNRRKQNARARMVCIVINYILSVLS
jgi:hypothetical protein